MFPHSALQKMIVINLKHEMKTRQHEIFGVSRSYGKRFGVSAIPSMQRLLNKEYKKQQEALKSLLSPTNYAC